VNWVVSVPPAKYIRRLALANSTKRLGVTKSAAGWSKVGGGQAMQRDGRKRERNQTLKRNKEEKTPKLGVGTQ